MAQVNPSFSDTDHNPTQTEAGIEVFEVVGSIKWFNASKGYGFITPDNGLADIMLHVTCLRAGGYQTAYEGARVHCEVLRRPKGMQASRILDMDESAAIPPSQLPQRTHVVVQPQSDWERATVKWFSSSRGYGFLTRGEKTADIFVHKETVRRFGFAEFKTGQMVQVRWGTGPKGLMAAELRPV
ncbi:cold-shock protein [Candidatus Wolfebacteria bacterium RIFCSPHIGHO2_01_FULL_48_22]|uniref:Cold-shock protein n=2 Tax=Candidatus Wolfeibacteriota TaxID=1752735 RepID=A0A1F8DSK0_9BACT|nr:MAG: cold-shock protein [Candidatus Wolfebacteria bacterium RIFCSPHIGHO2_01_FULL_48_22]OGM93422.1 MAG: cold-shock protein [Candidatus Wolfebacteria bacterium RIFCSPLOWO2_01_FULL_47_17b]